MSVACGSVELSPMLRSGILPHFASANSGLWARPSVGSGMQIGEPSLSGSGEAALQILRDALVGLPLSHLWRGYGSAIFLEFGLLAPRIRPSGKVGNPKGEIGLMIQWSWRIEDTSSILCGSWSAEHLWEPTFDLLRKKEVTELSVVGRLPEIVVGLTGGLYVSSFMTAEGDPTWAYLIGDPAP
jgi:hypothetical protein